MNHLLSPNKVITGAKYASPEAASLTAANTHLKILITPSQLVYLVADINSKKVVLLQPYQFSRITSAEEWRLSVDSIFEKDDWLRKEVAEKKTGIFTSSFTLVPAVLDLESSGKELLAMNCAVEAESVIFSDPVAAGDIHLVYTLSPAIVQKCRVYGGGSPVHALTGFINYLLAIAGPDGKEHLFVYVQSTSFQLIFIRNKSLLFCNSFGYQSPEDFMYHLLFACKQLRIDPELIPLTLMGEVMRDSTLFLLLVKYIRRVEFSKPHNALRFSDDYPLPPHFFFNLFCL
ncbi:MAG: DUF3822 family protein [Chitinophagales bacterium]